MTATHTLAPAWLQCDGKEGFDSPQLAADVARRRNRSKKHRGQLERALGHYRCPHCNRWHIGGMSR